MTTFTKVESAQVAGEYKSTQLDATKKEVDFRIVQANPFYIRWHDGRGEMVTRRQLDALKKTNTWNTDF
jgi:hypothetical protein